jgi:hypothetical protein
MLNGKSAHYPKCIFDSNGYSPGNAAILNYILILTASAHSKVISTSDTKVAGLLEIMISAKTIELMDFAFRVGGILGLSAFQFDKKTQRVCIVKRGRFVVPIWRMVIWSCILIQILFTLANIFLTLTYPIPTHEIVVYICFEILYSIAFLVQHMLLTKTDETAMMLNHFLTFDEKCRKYWHILQTL